MPSTNPWFSSSMLAMHCIHVSKVFEMMEICNESSHVWNVIWCLIPTNLGSPSIVVIYMMALFMHVTTTTNSASHTIFKVAWMLAVTWAARSSILNVLICDLKAGSWVLTCCFCYFFTWWELHCFRQSLCDGVFWCWFNLENFIQVFAFDSVKLGHSYGTFNIIQHKR